MSKGSQTSEVSRGNSGIAVQAMQGGISLSSCVEGESDSFSRVAAVLGVPLELLLGSQGISHVAQGCQASFQGVRGTLELPLIVCRGLGPHLECGGVDLEVF